MLNIGEIHHISAIVGNAQENLNFYRDVLGLKLIKQTLNYDDSSVYHLYFSNQQVTSDFIMTFFPWERNFYGRKGSGQIGRIAFKVPSGKLQQWEHYLFAKGIETTLTHLFDKPTLEFQDIHRLDLALVETEEENDSRAILGFYGVVLLSNDPDATKKFVTDDLGLVKISEEHYQTVGKNGQLIVIPNQVMPKGRWGIGTVHHLAWSVDSINDLGDWQSYLFEQGQQVSEIKNRNYFNSIYLTEFGNVIFEFATNGPGFEIDESFEELGNSLIIPPHFENQREALLKNLKPLDL